VDVSKDRADWQSLTDSEKHIFISNLKYQTLLDSMAARSVNAVLLPLVSLPELETWIETWAFSETIHSRSYTHLIRNVYTDPSKVFDELLNIEEIVDCAEDISKYYDDLIEYGSWYNLLGEGKHEVNSKVIHVSKYELKRKIWMAINSVNALEGIRFYVSFACSWAFAELKKMEGNAKIIKLIARDENLHLASTQHMLKLLPEHDKDFKKIEAECAEDVRAMFIKAVDQEKEWADYLFKDGSMIGLNADLLKQYVEWIAARRMRKAGIDCPYKVPQANPLPWTQKWIAGGEVQVAPQETEITSYVIGGVKKDVNENTFQGLSL
jgi:ribonucleoside-diphosphate reductase beta chain